MESAAAPSRIQSVDALRGAIIILMALGHVRDFTSAAAMAFSPTDLLPDLVCGVGDQLFRVPVLREIETAAARPLLARLSVG